MFRLLQRQLNEERRPLPLLTRKPNLSSLRLDGALGDVESEAVAFKFVPDIACAEEFIEGVGLFGLGDAAAIHANYTPTLPSFRFRIRSSSTSVMMRIPRSAQ